MTTVSIAVESGNDYLPVIGKVVNDLRLLVNGTLPVSGNLNDQTFGIQGIFEDMFSEEDVKDILGFDAIRPDGAPWV